MSSFLQFFVHRVPRDERGNSYVEYVFLVALIAVVCIMAVQFFGNGVSASLSTTGSHVSTLH